MSNEIDAYELEGFTPKDSGVLSEAEERTLRDAGFVPVLRWKHPDFRYRTFTIGEALVEMKWRNDG